MKDMILYHGSRGGIVGEIAPRSRVRCDFGAGFYLGTNPNQVKSLVAHDSLPVFYSMRFRLSHIEPAKILILKDMEWAYFVLYNRGRLEEIKGTAFYEKYSSLGKRKEVIIGPIADDNMNFVMRRFMDNQITDYALLESIRSINYGNQYTAKTISACKEIEIVSEKPLEMDEILYFSRDAYRRREESRQMVDQILLKYRRVGQYLDEVLNSFQQRERDSFER